MKNCIFRRFVTPIFFMLFAICLNSCTTDDPQQYNLQEFTSSFKDYSITATDYWTSLDSPAYDISLFHGTNQSVNSVIYYKDNLPENVSIKDIINSKAERYKASYNSFSTVNDIEARVYDDKDIFSALYKATTSNSSGYIYMNAVDMSETENAYILFIDCSPISDFSKYKTEFDEITNSAKIVGKPDYVSEDVSKNTVSVANDKFLLDVQDYWSVSKNEGTYDLWLDYGQASVGIYTYSHSHDMEADSMNDTLTAQAEKISNILPEFELIENLDTINSHGKSYLGSVYLANDGDTMCYVRLNVMTFDDNKQEKLILIHVAPVTMFSQLESDINDILNSVKINQTV